MFAFLVDDRVSGGGTLVRDFCRYRCEGTYATKNMYSKPYRTDMYMEIRKTMSSTNKSWKGRRK